MAGQVWLRCRLRPDYFGTMADRSVDPYHSYLLEMNIRRCYTELTFGYKVFSSYAMYIDFILLSSV